MTSPVASSTPPSAVETCACAYAASPHPAERSARPLRSCAAAPAAPSGDAIRIPFGHGRDGAPTIWESSAGRRLLVRHRDAASYPHLPIALAVTTALAQASHDIYVVDPLQRHPWLAHVHEDTSIPVEWAPAPGRIEQTIDLVVSADPGRPRLLVVAGLEQSLDGIDDDHRQVLRDVILRSRQLELTVLATTTEPTERWFRFGPGRAFDDVIERGTTIFERHSRVTHRSRAEELSFIRRR